MIVFIWSSLGFVRDGRDVDLHSLVSSALIIHRGFLLMLTQTPKDLGFYFREDLDCLCIYPFTTPGWGDRGCDRGQFPKSRIKADLWRVWSVNCIFLKISEKI
jgi:hypothetical protein